MVAMLEIVDIYKSFGQEQALAGISFEVHQGEVLAILGPSGCGKSTLLSVIAGLETADSGTIAWDGSSLAGVPTYQRGFGLMFQDFALFPHKNVFENVAFGLQMQRISTDQIQSQVQAALEMVGLPGYEKRDVNTLSGGEQQRVALARALAPAPRLLMLDEPLGSLDRNLRERLVLELREILRHSQQTAVYVTHDQQEAFILADRLVVMNAGRIEQTGNPETIYCQPANLFVARFLGLDNLFEGVIQSRSAGHAQVDTPLGNLEIPLADETLQAGQVVTILLRPDAVEPGTNGNQNISGTLEESVFRGSVVRAVINFQGTRLAFDLPNDTDLPPPGKPVTLSFNPAQALQTFNS
jgi:ABC-type Fe3+/spermidine/putrescine transport system ATPase subunit